MSTVLNTMRLIRREMSHSDDPRLSELYNNVRLGTMGFDEVMNKFRVIKNESR